MAVVPKAQWNAKESSEDGQCISYGGRCGISDDLGNVFISTTLASHTGRWRLNYLSVVYCTLSVLLGLLLPLQAYSKVLSYRATGLDRKFYIRNHHLHFTVIHPLKVVKGSTQALEGFAVLSPKGFQGVYLETVVMSDSFQFENEEIRSVVLGIIKSSENPRIGIQSRFFELTSLDGVGFRGIAKSRIQISGSHCFVDVHMNCQFSTDSVLSCHVGSVLRPSEFGIIIPQMMGIPAQDKIEVWGEVNFSSDSPTPTPKKKQTGGRMG